MIHDYDITGIFEDAAETIRSVVIPLDLGIVTVSLEPHVRDVARIHEYASDGQAFLFEPPGVQPEGFDLSETFGYVGLPLRGVLMGVVGYETGQNPSEIAHALKAAVWDALLDDPGRGGRCFDTKPAGFGHTSTLHEDRIVYAIHIQWPVEWGHD